MENHISKFIPALSSFIGFEGEARNTTTFDPKAVELVNKLFTFFYGTCRGFDKQFRDPKRLIIEKTQWYHVFTDEKITEMTSIELGLKKCRLYSPINTPTVGQFIEWCRPTMDDLGLLNKEKAFKRANEINQQFATEPTDLNADQLTIIKHVIQETGAFELRTKAESMIRPIFERNYEIAVRDFISGKLKSIPKAIQDKQKDNVELNKQKEISKKYEHLTGYEQAMLKIKETLGMKNE